MNEIQAHEAGPLWPALRRLGHRAIRRAEEAIDELPGIARRLRTFLVVASLSLAVLVAAGVLLVLHKVL